MLENPEHSGDREFTVILEDLRSKFEVFGEGLQDVREHVSRVEKTVEEMKTVTVTKDELRFVASQMATKDELQRVADQMATKDELQRVADQMATKDELQRVADKLQRVASQMATKDALQRVSSQQMTTQKSLDRFFNTLSDHEHRIHSLEKTSRI